MSNDQAEDFRLCPTCRMSISIWATKCRYCGESVGRPKKEESHFTIKDLGGQPQKVYTLSGNVTDALESFRVEEATTTSEVKRVQEAKRQSWLVRKFRGAAAGSEKRDEPGLPELDEYHRSLTSTLDRPSTAGRRQPTAALASRILKLGFIVVLLVVLGFAADFAWARISAYIESRNAVVEEVYNNQAEIWLAQDDKPLIDVLVEAQTARSINDTPENREILDRVRAAFITEIRDLLSSNPFNMENLDRARRLMNRAMAKPDPAISALNDEVQTETAYYSMTLNAIGANSATFRLDNNAFPQKEQVAEAGERVQDRFLVTRITRHYVVLEDPEAPGGSRTFEMSLHRSPRGR